MATFVALWRALTGAMGDSLGQTGAERDRPWPGMSFRGAGPTVRAKPCRL